VDEAQMANEALLLLLILGWAAVLLPSAIRSRRKSTLASVGGFERAMDVLRNRPDGRQVMVPRDADRAGQIVGELSRPVIGPAAAGVPSVGRQLPSRQTALLERRRQVFVRMLAADGVALVTALVFGGMFWTAFLLGAGVLAGYATLLRHYKVERDHARQVVRTIDIREFDQPTPAERELMAVGAERHGERYDERYEGLQVANRPDEPWEPQSSVRIRRWN
jgi:hypothetical protein